eukprot:9495631-Pyramimonas_sp.AAC.1
MSARAGVRVIARLKFLMIMASGSEWECERERKAGIRELRAMSESGSESGSQGGESEFNGRRPEATGRLRH